MSYLSYFSDDRIEIPREASGPPQIDGKPNSAAEFLVTFLNAWLFQGTVIALEDLDCLCMHLTECRRVLLTEWKIRTCPLLVFLRCSSESWLALSKHTCPHAMYACPSRGTMRWLSSLSYLFLQPKYASIVQVACSRPRGRCIPLLPPLQSGGEGGDMPP